MPTPEEQQYIREAVRALILEEDDTQRLSRPSEQDREGYDYVRSIQYDTVVEGLHSGRVAWGHMRRPRWRTSWGPLVSVWSRVPPPGMLLPSTSATRVAVVCVNPTDSSPHCVCGFQDESVNPQWRPAALAASSSSQVVNNVRVWSYPNCVWTFGAG